MLPACTARVTYQTDRTNELDVGAICYAIETQAMHTVITAGTPEVHSKNDQSTEFEAITLPSLRDLHRKARRMLSDASVAEDVVQETCLLAWQNFDRFTPGTNGRAWLFAILMNVVQHERRRRERWRIVPQSEEIRENCAAPTSTNTEALTDESLLEVIESIPLHYRQVLLMADVAELQYHEIAQALRIPMGTVMSRLFRARTRVRSQLTRFSENRRMTGPVTMANFCMSSADPVRQRQGLRARTNSSLDTQEVSAETLVA
jgi:RNA polymerase sigma-70 factor (ECF subfamily)